MRLVPDQDPQRITQLFREHCERNAGPGVTVRVIGDHGALAWVADPDHPAMRAAHAALRETFDGRDPVHMRLGGSIPVVALLDEHFSMPTVLMGFGLPDDGLHAPNERFSLTQFHRGIEAAIRFMAHYATI
jgi:acetylornithine deacetylase/succinyl-diaminopimelate desuccinylase-like protein